MADRSKKTAFNNSSLYSILQIAVKPFYVGLGGVGVEF